MSITEKVGVLTFLAIVIIIYWIEMKLLVTCLISKARGKKCINVFLSKRAVFVHILATVGILCFMYGYYIEPYWIEVETVEIRTEKLNHTSLKVVHISDVHCDLKIRNEKKIVEIINEIGPDIIVFTGDTLNTSSALTTFKGMMSGLNAGIGKYAVRGNFDVWFWPDIDLFGNTGFQELDGDIISLEKGGEKFQISGLSSGNGDMSSNMLKDISADQFNMFLFHYPDLIEDLKGLNVDLYLAGHTHGGQVALPVYGALMTLAKYGKKYEAGRYDVDGTVLYINRGIGMEAGHAPRVRFLARPEITVYNIEPKSNAENPMTDNQG